MVRRKALGCWKANTLHWAALLVWCQFTLSPCIIESLSHLQINKCPIPYPLRWVKCTLDSTLPCPCHKAGLLPQTWPFSRSSLQQTPLPHKSEALPITHPPLWSHYLNHITWHYSDTTSKRKNTDLHSQLSPLCSFLLCVAETSSYPFYTRPG